MRGRSILAACAVGLMLLGSAPGAMAAPGTKTGHVWRSGCPALGPNPWVNADTQGTTNVNAPGSSYTHTCYNSVRRDRQFKGTYNGGKYTVSTTGNIYLSGTYGYCSDM